MGEQITYKSSTVTSQWSSQQQLRYYFYLILRIKEFTQITARVRHFYKDMALFITSRNQSQCKSHHQKKKITPHNALQKLADFIQDQYDTRQLHYSHATTEMERYLRSYGLQYCSPARKIDQLIEIFDQNLRQIATSPKKRVSSSEEQGDNCFEKETKEITKKEEDHRLSSADKEISQTLEIFASELDKIDQVPKDPQIL